MAISKMVLKTMQKIHRPAIVSIMPHLNGRYVMLDLGANTGNATPSIWPNLRLWATLSPLSTRWIFKQPKVALLNIGAEAHEGQRGDSSGCLDAATTLSLTSILPVISNRTKFPTALADVIVADGFTGNAALKPLEGTARLVIRMIKKAIKRSFLAKLDCRSCWGYFPKSKEHGPAFV